ncbi:acetyl-CoA C-acetyltransferase [Salinisphaera orenii]|uniref:acetyl-CoA C-acetyltransferase n=1 Tax=Salinisphaera orenii TaxID=856731 RepID=UPI000DBE730E
MSQALPRRVALVGGSRIPFCRASGPYVDASNIDMLAAALECIDKRFELGGQVDEIAAGAVLKHARDVSLTREAALGAGFNPEVSTFDVSRACATSLEAAVDIGNKIALGQIDAGVAAGVDSASDVPIEINDDLRRILLDINHARHTTQWLRQLTRLRPGQLKPDFPNIDEPRTGLSMGKHCEQMAKHWGISRAAQDELAAASHANAAAAYEAGFFDDLVADYRGVTRDTNLRPDANVDKMSGLAPAFDREHGTITAANATALTDGAAGVVLASEDWAAARGLPVQAWLTPFSRSAAVDFASGDEGLLMAPARAVPKMLDAAGLSLGDFDYYEIHEAFAAQVLCTLAAWESEDYCRNVLGRQAALGAIDRSRLNVNGSSIALGHPFAATGARILAMLAKLLYDNGGGRGLVSVCAAGGQGMTAILER